MRIVGVPVVDGDPVERRAEVAFGIPHQLAREGTKVVQPGRILRGDDEAEMMPIAFAALGEGAVVRSL